MPTWSSRTHSVLYPLMLQVRRTVDVLGDHADRDGGDGVSE
jgi:hypothetical protein